MLKREKREEKNTPHLSSTLSTLSFMTLLYFASTEKINPALSTNQDRRNDGPDSNL